MTIRNIVVFLKNYTKSLKHHKRRLLILLIPLIVLTIIFWPRPQKPIGVQAAEKHDLVESISATGTVSSETSVDLHFLSAGKLAYLGVKKGDLVKAGQVIANLDLRTVQKNLETELRDYASQRITFDQTRTDNQNRTPDEALNDSMKHILQNNQYDLEKAVISVELQDLARQQAILVSPINGIITATDVTTSGVNVTTTTTFTIADPKNLIFKIDIDEADIGKVKLDQKAKVTLDAFPDKTLDLKIKSIDFASHTTSTGGNVFTVEVLLPDNTDLLYRIGLNGDAEIVTNEKKNVLTIPLSSLFDDNFVYVKTGGKFEKRKVSTGLSNDTQTEIKSGLKAGEEVALDPTEAEKRAKK